MNYLYIVDGKKRLVTEQGRLAFEERYPQARLLNDPNVDKPQPTPEEIEKRKEELASPGRATDKDVHDYTEKRIAKIKEKQTQDSQQTDKFLYQLPDGKKRIVPVGNRLAFESKYPDAKALPSDIEDKITSLRARNADTARRILKEQKIAEGILPPDREPTKAEEWDAMIAPPSNVFTAMLRKIASAGQSWGQTTLGLASFLTDFAGAVTGKDIKSDDTFLGDWSESLDAMTRALNKDAEDAGFTSKLVSNAVSGVAGMSPMMLLQIAGIPAPLSAAIMEFGQSYSTDTAESVAKDEANPDKLMRFVDATVRAGIAGSSEMIFRGIANQGGIKQAVGKMGKEEFKKFIAKEVTKSKAVNVVNEMLKGAGQEGVEGAAERVANIFYDAIRGKETGFENMHDKELAVALISDIGTTFATEATAGIMMSGMYAWDANKKRMKSIKDASKNVKPLTETPPESEVTPTTEIPAQKTFVNVDSAKNVSLGNQIGRMMDLVESQFKQGKPVTESEVQAIRDAVRQIEDVDIRTETMKRFDEIKLKYDGKIIPDTETEPKKKVATTPKDIKLTEDWAGKASEVTKKIDSIEDNRVKGKGISIDEVSQIETEMKDVVESVDSVPGANMDSKTIEKWESTIDTAKIDALFNRVDEVMDSIDKGIPIPSEEVGKLSKLAETVKNESMKKELQRNIKKIKADNKHLTLEKDKQEALPKEKPKKEIAKPKKKKLSKVDKIKEETKDQEVEVFGKKIEPQDGTPVITKVKPKDLNKAGRQPKGTATQVVSDRKTEKEFSRNVKAEGQFSVVELDNIQPSHIYGERNPYYLAEIQRKDRTVADSHIANQNAKEKDPTKLLIDTDSPYDGVININSRGEVIQGNNRAESLGYLYDLYPEKAEKYKNVLIRKAKEFGFSDEQIAKIKEMEKPILSNLIDVDDENAIKLGQYKQEDRETGGVRDFEGKAVWRKLKQEGKNRLVRKITGYFDKMPDASIKKISRENSNDILGYLVRRGVIDNAQVQGAFDSKGNLSGKGLENIRDTIIEAMLGDTTIDNRDKFLTLPEKAQSLIVRIGGLQEPLLSSSMNSIISNFDRYYSGDYPTFNAFTDEIDIYGKTIDDKATPLEQVIIDILTYQDTKGFASASKSLINGINRLMNPEESIFEGEKKLGFKEALSQAIKENDFFNGLVDVSRLEGKVDTKTSPKPPKSTTEQPKTVKPTTDTKTKSKAVEGGKTEPSTKAGVVTENAEIAYGSVEKKDRAVKRVARKIENNLKNINVKEVDVRDIPFKDFLKQPLKSEILEDFKESKDFSLVGKKIGGFADLYALLQIHRSPYIEKTHIIYLDDKGDVVGNQIFTFGMPMASVVPTFNSIQFMYSQIGAKSFYIAHNHPSGDVTPSSEDMGVTERMIKYANKNEMVFNGHLILNHDKYTVLEKPESWDYDGVPVKSRTVTNLEPVAKPTYTKFLRAPGNNSLAHIGKALTENPYNGGAIMYGRGKIIEQIEILPPSVDSDDYRFNIKPQIEKRLISQKQGFFVIFHKGDVVVPSIKANNLINGYVFNIDSGILDNALIEEFDYGEIPSSLIYSSFDSDMALGGYDTYELKENIASYTPDFEKQIYPELRKTMNKVGWTTQDLATHIATFYSINTDITGKVEKGVLPEINKSLKLVTETMSTREIELIDRSKRFANAPIKVLEDKELTVKQREQIKDKLKNYNKRLLRVDPTQKLPKGRARQIVDFNFIEKYYYNVEDLFYKMTEVTKDVRFTKLAQVLPDAMRILEAEAGVVVKLLDNVKNFIKTKEDNVLLGNYLQQIGNYKEMRKKENSEFREAVQDLVQQMESTKGVIAMSRVYDAISGVASPGNRKFYTKPQEDQIKSVKAYFGNYYDNQQKWEEFFDAVMLQIPAEKMAIIYPGLNFDYSLFTVKNYLPVFLDTEVAKEIAEQNGQLTEDSIEEAYEGMERDNALRADTTKVRTGKAKELDDALNLAGGVLLRALRLKYLDRLVRRTSQIAKPYLKEADWRMLNNNLRHILGQTDYGKFTKLFRKFAGFHYRLKVVGRVFNLPLKNISQTLISADKITDMPKIVKSLFNTSKRLEKLLGEDVMPWVLSVSEQKSNIADAYALTKGATQQLENYKKESKSKKIIQNLNEVQRLSRIVDELIVDGGFRLYMASDKLNRMASLLYNLEMITNAWQKMTSFDKFLDDVRFHNIPPALARQLLDDLNSKGISEFARNLAYYRNISTNYEYNRGLGSLYANKPGLFWAGSNQYRVWSRRFSMNYARKVMNLAKNEKWKELGALLGAMIVALLLSNEFTKMILGQDEKMILASDSTEEAMKRAMLTVFYNPSTYNVSTIYSPAISSYNIKQFFAGEGNLDYVVEDMFLGATMSEAIEFGRTLWKTGSAVSNIIAESDATKVERKKDLALAGLDNLVGMATDYSPVIRFIERSVNTQREHPYWKSSMLRILGIANPNITYYQKFDSEYAKFVYILNGNRGERLKGLPKREKTIFDRYMKNNMGLGNLEKDPFK